MSVANRSMGIAAARFATARTIAACAALIAAAVCARGLVGWWALLPLWAVQAELVCRLFDARVVGRAPPPASSPRSPRAAADEDGVFTWQEVAEHNTEHSAWIAVDGSVFDVTPFIDRHPGGREMLLLAVGREATDLFNSYHPFTEMPRTILAKYRIGSLATFEHPIYKPDSGFYKDAARAVDKYFKDNNIDSKNPWTGIKRMAPVYVLFALSFVAAYCTPGLPMRVRVVLAIFLGMCQGMPLTGWMHDASHASIGHSEKWWWAVGRGSLDYVSGSSMLSWRNQHVLGHHVYTNVMGADPDLPSALTGDPRRLVPEQVWQAMYKYQHIYLPPLYGILGLKSRLQDLTEVFSQHTNGPIRVNPISVQDHLRMLSSKAIWFFYRVVVPCTFFKVLSAPQMTLLFFLTEFTTGYWLAFNFQVSHVSDDADFLFCDVTKRESGKCPAMFDEEWAVTQIKTTVDYGHGSPAAAYLSGALNYQTVHHLFPTVSQYHYPAITPIVQEIAKKYKLDFNVHSTFTDAFASHIEHLRKMGIQGKAAELKME